MVSDTLLSLWDFKCFERQDLHLGPITVLTGANSGGKTSILQALALLKWFYEQRDRVGALRDDCEWPDTCIGGLALPDVESFTRFGSTTRPKIRLSNGSESAELLLDPDGPTMTHLPAPGILNGVWRINPAARLALSTEQHVGARRHDRGRIVDSCHALLELLAYEHRPKPGSEAAERSLRAVVESTIAELTSPTIIDLARTELSGVLKLEYRGTSVQSEAMSPAQYGAGVTAVLPLAIHLCAAVDGETVMCQDPEMHLHPRGQSHIGRVIAAAALRGVRVIVETHSEHVISGIKLGLLRRQALIVEYMRCYFLGLDPRHNTAYQTSNVVSEVQFDERGRTVNWPKGYFDQGELDFLDMVSGADR